MTVTAVAEWAGSFGLGLAAAGLGELLVGHTGVSAEEAGFAETVVVVVGVFESI